MALKRGFDLLASLSTVAVTLPLWGMMALLIKLDSPGPVLYRGPRVGRGGGTFHIYKFRSMANEEAGGGPAITAKGDDRVTRVGRFLRATKIDELPQLLNVLKGDMSSVGPRPEHPRYVAHYTKEQRWLLSVRPGLVSPATLAYRHEEALLAGSSDPEEVYLNVILPDKLRRDLKYLERRSLAYDLALVARTVLGLFRRPRPVPKDSQP
jgi:lipopolysaccharide/colanic/teichoic acid biosynthesis glycosyltransferase